MCLMCEEEAFFQAYMDELARKQAGAARSASAFRAEAVDGDDAARAAVPNDATGEKAQSS